MPCTVEPGYNDTGVSVSPKRVNMVHSETVVMKLQFALEFFRPFLPLLFDKSSFVI
jgi:hypothetical protein